MRQKDWVWKAAYPVNDRQLSLIKDFWIKHPISKEDEKEDQEDD